MEKPITKIEMDMRLLGVILKFASNITEEDILNCVNYENMEFDSNTIQKTLEILNYESEKAFDYFYESKYKK